jgi:hypothetical protein
LDDEPSLSGRIQNFAAPKPEFARLCAQETGTEITLAQELRSFRLLFGVEDLISRTRHLTSIFSVALFEMVLLPPRVMANALIVMNTGYYKKVGCFAYRILNDGQEDLTLVDCKIAELLPVCVQKKRDLQESFQA